MASSWSQRWAKNANVLNAKDKPTTSKDFKRAETKAKGKELAQSTRNRDVTYFKCLGKGHIASQCPN